MSMHDAQEPRGEVVRFSQLYTELRALAEREFRGQGAQHTLQPTALVNEAWLKLRGAPGFENKGHVMGTAVKAMRHVLVDHARRRRASKRGGELQRVTLLSGDGAASELAAQHALDVCDLDAALTRLASEAPRRARVVELKFFGGLTIPEIADTLQVSHMTVSDDWRKARVWLARELGS